MVKLAGTFNRFSATKVMVIGDYFLDAYTIGKARRISPEAPVPIVNVVREECRAGGAGNVVLNLLSLGAQVVPVGRIGEDEAGIQLRKALATEKLNTDGLFVQGGYPTPVKNRIIADGQQIVRVDNEVVMPLPEQLEQTIIDSLPQLLEGVQVVAVSDYGKGFLSSTLLAALIQLAKARNIFVIVDPKGLDFAKYAGATIIKPNLGEAYAAANLPHHADIDLVARKLIDLTQIDTLMITRSEAGISLFEASGKREDYPVRIREVKDVTGAGDTVLAMLSYAMGNQLSIFEAAQLSNLAAGVAIERFGCARVSLSDVARALIQFDSTNKIIEGSHLFALRQAVSGTSSVIIDVSSQPEISPALLGYILNLNRRDDQNLLVVLGDKESASALIHILKELKAVDFIILNDDKSIEQIVELLQPEELYQFTEGDTIIKK